MSGQPCQVKMSEKVPTFHIRPVLWSKERGTFIPQQHTGICLEKRTHTFKTAVS